jgi:hypothetical protein
VGEVFADRNLFCLKPYVHNFAKIVHTKKESVLRTEKKKEKKKRG